MKYYYFTLLDFQAGIKLPEKPFKNLQTFLINLSSLYMIINFDASVFSSFFKWLQILLNKLWVWSLPKPLWGMSSSGRWRWPFSMQLIYVFKQYKLPFLLYALQYQITFIVLKNERREGEERGGEHMCSYL